LGVENDGNAAAPIGAEVSDLGIGDKKDIEEEKGPKQPDLRR